VTILKANEAFKNVTYICEPPWKDLKFTKGLYVYIAVIFSSARQSIILTILWLFFTFLLSALYWNTSPWLLGNEHHISDGV